MTPSIAGTLIAIGSALIAALGLAAGALWRLGSKVGGFEAAVVASTSASVEAKKAALEAQIAAQRASADAIAASRSLYDAVAAMVRGFQVKLEEVCCELAEARGHWMESHDLVEKVNDHEKRLYSIERDHERNHGMAPLPMEQSARHYLPVPPESPAADEPGGADDKGKRGGV